MQVDAAFFCLLSLPALHLRGILMCCCTSGIEMMINVTEYRRPWKLSTLAIGLGLLIWGSFYYQAPDWDIPISVIMALLAYLTAPWSLRVIMERKWARWPVMLFATWFSIDGCYWIYWHFKNPVALELMREANSLASLSLYGMCGVIWLYRGSLRELWLDVKAMRITR